MSLNLEIEVQGCESSDISVTNQCESSDINVTNQCETLTLEITEGSVSASVAISAEPDNRLEMKSDGLYIRDLLDPNPVAYYLLSRG